MVKIIFEFQKLTNKYKKRINFAFKFQYRDSKSFIRKAIKTLTTQVLKDLKQLFYKKTMEKFIKLCR